MLEDEFTNLGPVKQLVESPDSYEILITPDGEAHNKWGSARSSTREQWEARVREILARHTDCIAIRVLINI
jgi:hypothetical protein